MVLRRTLLSAVGAAGLAGLVGCGRTGDGSDPPWTPLNRLTIPPVEESEHPTLRLRTGRTAFVPHRPVETWGINGAFLGPTLRWRRGVHVAPTVINDLPEPTTLHWHGMHLPGEMDGGPHQTIDVGGRWRPTWRVINPASTLWYHPHPHGSTARHVFNGVAGMIIVDDDGPALPSRYGVDDIPCLLTDRTLDEQGRPEFDGGGTFGQLGRQVLVNGTPGAYLPVTSRITRLRLLNASSARLYHLEIEDGRPVTVIANDAGLLPEPVPVDIVTLGPGERCEMLVELAPGERVRLVSRPGNEATIDAEELPVLELRAAVELASAEALPHALGGPGPVTPAPDATVRRFELNGHDAINGQPMDLTRIDEVVPRAAIEIWRVENPVYSHNFHIHGADFTILDRDGAAPAAFETGRKDTVHLPPHSGVRLAVSFADFADPQAPYMYHCHMLRHEDSGMMGQYVLVEPGTEAATSRTVGMGHGTMHHS